MSVHQLEQLLSEVLSDPCFSSTGLTLQSKPSDFARFLCLAKGTACWVQVTNTVGEHWGTGYIGVLVKKNCTRKEVQRAVQFHVKREGRGVNWRGVWRKYTLAIDGKPLSDGTLPPFEPGQQLTFIRK